MGCVMVKVQLGKSGGFINVKDDCTHKSVRTMSSGVYEYAVCNACGKVIGEIHEIKGESNQSS